MVKVTRVLPLLSAVAAGGDGAEDVVEFADYGMKINGGDFGLAHNGAPSGR